jgi:OHCU decarboxylase
MTDSVDALNALALADAEKDFLACGGVSRWAHGMAARRPFSDPAELSRVADELWRELGPDDWLEAFSRHPKIGQKIAPPEGASAESPESDVAKKWSSQEQTGVQRASADVITRLARGNDAYWERFGFIFIVCATGKTAEQMLAILERRIQNERSVELPIAAEELRQIMHIRLQKLLTARSQ